MKKYNCESCNFHTDHKPNYLRHLRTSKHNKSSKSHQLVTPKSPISHQLYNNMYLENFKPFRTKLVTTETSVEVFEVLDSIVANFS